MLQRRTLGVGAAAVALGAPRGGRAQAAWPLGRPIRVICPTPPGGANDMLARLLAQRLQDRLGAVAVVENRPGGSALLGTNIVLQAPPDGFTLLASTFNTAVMPLVLKGANFDPQSDLTVMARTAKAPLVMMISGTRPERTVQEVVAAAKARPRDWSIAISALGSAGHLATIDFMRRTGVDLNVVTYRGTQPALTDLMGGSAQLLIDPSFALLASRADGRIRVLGIASPQRSPLTADVPTMAEAGLPGFEFQAWYGVWGPKGTPPGVTQRVHTLVQETMRDPEIAQRLATQVIEPVVESIDDSRRFIATEIRRAEELLRSVNYQPE
ncbi:tripartite tricarboxylate transporter substrate binding protein [Sediminicoccus sp. KRV36]|uniref:Bug family tripartite tricarboxylate transporter substrate binding protein n=1 Tax=Sediminicoccus sp. KRV36 TaxID=3133721 RepID=UPI00200CFF62|nr:tripartite tricarboxylate transporter substrate binding protein [Sediminicoccus rosea]UPY38897.1 tripartite tricarboxylate transporter substrate binding protein [Sediminicoccus rosea]